MKPRYLTLGVVAVLTAAALTGCARFTPVSGPMTSESPEIGDVTAVVLDTAGDLTITEGEPSLTIHAPASVLDALTSTVSDGVLVLGRRGPDLAWGNVDIRYELTVPSLESIEVNGAGDVDSTVSGENLSIEVSGAGDVTVDGVDADRVEVRISGAGDIELDGTAQSLEVEIDGVGEVDADDLEVVDAVVDISGAGDAHVNATGTLTAEVSGVGSVHYRGDPDVDSDISGLGEVVEDD
jgi:hypothetical protein